MPAEEEASPEGAGAASEPERLQRILARAGLGSRRAAEDLIRDGRVRIRGRVARLGDRADPSRDEITLDGVPVAADPALRYFAFNKPAGVTTTLGDPYASSTLAGFLPPGPRVFPVGRLDRDSEGLLVLTNDGRLAHRLQHPRYGVEKEYLAEVNGTATRRTALALVRGVALEDGAARAVKATPVVGSGGRSALRVVMIEGRKREVRRMLSAVGLPVTRLVRTRVGSLALGDLAPGRRRRLRPDEVLALYRSAGTGARSSSDPEPGTTRR